MRSGSVHSTAGIEPSNKRRQSAGRDGAHGFAEFALDAGDDAFDEADIAPEDAGLHAGDGARADHLLGARDRHRRQLRRRHGERLERQVDAGRDRAAAIVAVAIDHVEGRGGAEIDDDERPLVALVRRDRVDEAVRSHLLRPVDARLDPGRDARLADDERIAVAIGAAQAAQIEVRIGHDARDDGAVDVVARQIIERQEMIEPHDMLVSGAARIGAGAPRAFQ